MHVCSVADSWSKGRGPNNPPFDQEVPDNYRIGRAMVEQWDDKRPDENGKTILAVNMEEDSAPKEVYIAVGSNVSHVARTAIRSAPRAKG